MPNHPNRTRPAVARRAALLGYELAAENKGSCLMRWRLWKEGRDTEYFDKLADVSQRLDIEEAHRA